LQVKKENTEERDNDKEEDTEEDMDEQDKDAGKEEQRKEGAPWGIRDESIGIDAGGKTKKRMSRARRRWSWMRKSKRRHVEAGQEKA